MLNPCLAFKDGAEEAIKLYVSVFPNSKIKHIQLSEHDGPIAKGKVLNASFEIDGREYVAFDGGPTFNLSEGFSLMVLCKTQQEVDRYWTKLTEGGGEEGPCGWLKDRLGVSWQIVPEGLGELLSDAKSGNCEAATQAMLKMKELDVATLETAYLGSGVR